MSESGVCRYFCLIDDLKLHTFNILPSNMIFAKVLIKLSSFFGGQFDKRLKNKTKLLIYSLFARGFYYGWILNFIKCFLTSKCYFICITFFSCKRPSWITLIPPVEFPTGVSPCWWWNLVFFVFRQLYFVLTERIFLLSKEFWVEGHFLLVYWYIFPLYSSFAVVESSVGFFCFL